MFSSNGVMQGWVLTDGFVRGGWKPVTSGERTSMTITPFGKPMRSAEAREVEAEATKLLAFLAPGAKHDVRFGEVRD
jgi:hypothetical protein